MKNEIETQLVAKNITEAIHLDFIARMKSCLDRYEGFCRLEGGGDSKLFKLLKRELMDVVYDGENFVFDALQELGVLETCSCHSEVRGGYNSNCTQCHGAGKVYSSTFKRWAEQKK